AQIVQNERTVKVDWTATWGEPALPRFYHYSHATRESIVLSSWLVRGRAKHLILESDAALPTRVQRVRGVALLLFRSPRTFPNATGVGFADKPALPSAPLAQPAIEEKLRHENHIEDRPCICFSSPFWGSAFIIAVVRSSLSPRHRQPPDWMIPFLPRVLCKASRDLTESQQQARLFLRVLLVWSVMLESSLLTE